MVQPIPGRIGVAVILCGLVVAGESRYLAQEPAGNARLQRLEQWMTLAEHHQPGQLDDSARAVSAWPSLSLQDVRDDLYAIRRLICSTNGASPDSRRTACTRPPANQRGAISTETTVGHRDRGNTREWAGIYTANHLADLVELAPEIDRRGLNDILKRGALLHTDIALMVPPMVTVTPPAQRFLMRATVRVVDGVQTGFDHSVDHLAMARRLLDIVTPDPRHDPFAYPERDSMVRDWYRATMAVLLNDQQFAINHATAALELFRGDDEVLFQAGALHETLAAQRYQGGVTTRRVGDESVIDSADGELRRAEQLLRQALAVNTRHVEARLRLGQVLGQRGRAADARVELRQVEAATDDPLLSYFAALFIGREEAVLNNVDAARAAYQRAAALFPRAQSPYIGLSDLEMRSGNRSGAAQALEVVWNWGTSRKASDDPWKSYPYAAGRSGETMLAELGKAFPPPTTNP